MIADLAQKSPCKVTSILESVMILGFGPNMELPNKMKLGLTPTQTKNNAPTIALEWAKKTKESIVELTRVCTTYGMDLNARNNKGETLLGIVNRHAGNTKNALMIQKHEDDFFEIIKMGADPFGIANDKKSEFLAANDNFKAKIKANQERKDMMISLEQNVFDRAKELMVDAIKKRNSMANNPSSSLK